MSDRRGQRRGWRGDKGGGHTPRGAGGRGRGVSNTSTDRQDSQFRSGDRQGPREGQQRTSYASESSTGHGYTSGGHRGQYQGAGGGSGGGGGRGDGGGGGRGFGGGGRSTITFSSEPLSLDSKHVDGPRGFHTPVLPEKPDGFKALIPKDVKPGTLSQRKVHIQTNHVLANVQLPKELFRYEVTTTKIPHAAAAAAPQPEGAAPPRTLNKNLRLKIFQWLVPRIQQEWAQRNRNTRLGVLHDWSRIMVTNKRLNINLEYQVAHHELEDEDDSEVNYRVVITDSRLQVDIPQLQMALDNLRNAAESEDLNTIQQFYNILLKNIGEKAYVPLGRNCLMAIPSGHGFRLGLGLCNWKGVSLIYTMSNAWKPYVNIDIQNSAFRVGQRVDDAVQEILRDSGSDAIWNNITRWNNWDFESILDLLKSCKVTRQIAGRTMHGVVKNILREPPEQITFRCEELGNRDVTVTEYYALRYRIQLQNPLGLVLQIGQHAKVPAELCTIIKGQSYNRMLTNETVARSMLKQSTQKPQEKKASILAAINNLKMTNNPILQDFGVNFSGQLLDLKDTRVLCPPELCYGEASNGPSNANKPNRGRVMPQNGEWDQWNHRVKFFKPVNIDSWAVLVLDDVRTDEKRFINEFRNNGRNIAGINIPEPDDVIKRNNIRDNGDPEQNVANISAILNNWKQHLQWTKEMKTFVLVVIPRKGSHLYSQTKQAAELFSRAGVLTQCVVKKNFETANHSVVKNILLKVNCKLGGINHVAVIPRHLNKIDILRTPVMIVGIDVTHPSPGLGGRVAQPSFAAVTASIDRSGMPYMMEIQAQMKAERGAAEVVQNLDVIIKNMLVGFYLTTKKNHGVGIKPSKIIVYRDGVGTGQFPEVLHVEMRAIRNACEKLKDDDQNPYRPKITIIAVQKRHKVRFFLETQSGTENAPPGTVVDTEITKSDFYLLSHKGALGTSRPTHYQVLWDDSDFSADEIQALTYFLCYMYSRCNKAVSYPAPTYYAHWAAYRANALCKIKNQLPNWWNGDQESLNRLNDSLKRNRAITDGFPMHFV